MLQIPFRDDKRTGWNAKKNNFAAKLEINDRTSVTEADIPTSVDFEQHINITALFCVRQKNVYVQQTVQ